MHHNPPLLSTEFDRSSNPADVNKNVDYRAPAENRNSNDNGAM